MAAGLADAEAPLGIVPDWTAALITLSLDDVQLARVSEALARYAAARPNLVAEDIQGLGRFDLDVAVYARG